MEENKPVPVKRNDITVCVKPSVIAAKSIRGKRRRRNKRSKRLLFFTLIFIICGAILIKFESVKSLLSPYIQEFQTNAGDEGAIEQTIGNTAPSNDVDVGESKYSFIHTSPTFFETNNESSHKIDYEALDFSFQKKEEISASFSSTAPIVLIVHFSPYETYSQGNGYSENSKFYSTVNNVSNIGQHICKTLNENGINAIHLPNYDYIGNAYSGKEMYELAVKEILESNPSISYIFDVSRAIEINEDLSMNKETVNIGGINIPTVHFECGTNSTELTENNARSVCFMNEFATFINNKSPLFADKQTISKYCLSQVFNVPTLRVDIGSFACTYNEALLCANLFTVSLVDYLNN